MRTLFGYAVAAALLLVTTSAAAQIPQGAPSTIEIRAMPLDNVLDPNAVTVTRATVSYAYHFTGTLAPSDTRVDVHVRDLPPWLTVTVSPSTLHFSMHGTPGAMTTHAPPQDVAVTVAVAPNAPPGALASVKLDVTAHANAHVQSSHGRDVFLVKVTDAPLVVCDAPHDTAPDLTEHDASDVQAQSAGVTPLAGASSTLLLGLAGAGAGVGYAWHQRRRDA